MHAFNRIFRRCACPLVALLLAGTASATSTNLVTNGSFESVAQGAGSWNIYSTLNGWQVASNGIEIRNNVAGTAFDGNNFAELDTTANSWISQTIATEVGQTYLLSFFYSARPGVSLKSNPIDAYLNGSLAVAASADGSSNAANVWTDYTKTFVASSPFTTLTFAASGTSDSYGGSLDKIAVTVVPEPATWSLLAAGLGVLAACAVRRRTR